MAWRIGIRHRPHLDLRSRGGSSMLAATSTKKNRPFTKRHMTAEHRAGTAGRGSVMTLAPAKSACTGTEEAPERAATPGGPLGEGPRRRGAPPLWAAPPQAGRHGRAG